MAEQSVAEMHLSITIDTQLRLALFNLAMAAKRFLDVSHEFDGDHRYVDSEFFAALDERTKEALEVLTELPKAKADPEDPLHHHVVGLFAKRMIALMRSRPGSLMDEIDFTLQFGRLFERAYAMRSAKDALGLMPTRDVSGPRGREMASRIFTEAAEVAICALTIANAWGSWPDEEGG